MDLLDIIAFTLVKEKIQVKKKFFRIITFCFSLTLLAQMLAVGNYQKALAIKSQYLRITDTNTPFFSTIADGEALFYLPSTYYVKLISKGDIFNHVEYGGADGVTIDGYVPNQTLFSETQDVFSPYPNVTIKTSKTALLYADSKLTKSIKYIFEDRNLTYYGNFPLPDGTQCFYVSYGGDLGYVKESDVSPFSIPNHPNPLTYIPEQTPPPIKEPKKNTDNVNSLRIIIISSLILAGLSGLVVVIKKRPNIPINTYYDENDYE